MEGGIDRRSHHREVGRPLLQEVSGKKVVAAPFTRLCVKRGREKEEEKKEPHGDQPRKSDDRNSKINSS